ncbi:MAG TPA: hypothetical protein VEB86_04235 [Chryseosolibacter sp.]|nr:hypothetical protein [Chryseosolibacter sp.]
MKTTIIVVITLVHAIAMGQSFEETIKKEMSFEKKSSANTVLIANINGHIKVAGYEGDKVIVEVNKYVHGKTEARLEKGKQEIQLGIIDRADTLIFYTQDGCMPFGQNKSAREKNRWNYNGWGYNWNCNNGSCNNDKTYDHKMNYTVKVPRGVNIILSTVNDGDITVEKVRGAVRVNNVNGSIRLTDLASQVDAHTINGDVDIDYTVNPLDECRFYTLNGDINALFMKGLAADLSFESFNGDFYTNIDEIKPLPAKVEKSEKGEGIRFKVTGNRYQVGKGGVFLDFETFNGNVYLKEK